MSPQCTSTETALSSCLARSMASCAPTSTPTHISHLIIPIFPSPQPYMEFTIRTMPQDSSRRAQCHLVRENLDSKMGPTYLQYNNLPTANTCSFHQTRNTYSPQPTTAPYGCGTSRHRAA